jgi:hypothetical protein
MPFGLYPIRAPNPKIILLSSTVNCKYRNSSIYAVNVGTHKKTAESENCVNQGYLVVLKGRKIG